MAEAVHKDHDKVRMFLKGRDNFGSPIPLTLNGESNVQSVWGGIMSLIYLTVAYGYGIYIFYLFLTYSRLNVVYNELTENDPMGLSLVNETFYFALEMWDRDGNIVDLDKDFPYMEYWISTYETDLEGLPYNNKSAVQLNKCTNKEYFDSVYHNSEDPLTQKTSFWDNFYMNSALCPDDWFKNVSISKVADGIATQIKTRYFIISASIKEEYAKNETFIKEKEKYLNYNGYKLVLIYNDITVKPDNLNSPTSDYWTVKTLTMDWALQQEMDILLSSLDISTDKNVLSDNPQIQHNMTVAETNFRVRLVHQHDGDLYDRARASFLLKSSAVTLKYERSYMKLPEFLGEIEGTIAQIGILVALLISLVNDKNTPQKIAHRVMKYKGRHNHEYEHLKKVLSNAQRPEAKNSSRDVTGIKLEERNQTEDRFEEKVPENKYIPKHSELEMIVVEIKPDHFKETTKKNEQGNLKTSSKTKDFRKAPKDNVDLPEKLTNSDLMFSCICCCSCGQNCKKVNKGIEYIEKSGEHVNYYTDVVNIIRKFKELDVMKFILLNEHQLNILNFLGQPCVLFSDDTHSEIYKKFVALQNAPIKFNRDYMDTVANSYLEIINKEIVCDTDKKLLALFNSELGAIIED
jgi:hypothetical protein